MIPGGGDALGNGNLRQSGAIEKCVIPDGGDLVFLATDFYRSRNDRVAGNAFVGIVNRRLASFCIISIGRLKKLFFMTGLLVL